MASRDTATLFPPSNMLPTGRVGNWFSLQTTQHICLPTTPARMNISSATLICFVHGLKASSQWLSHVTGVLYSGKAWKCLLLVWDCTMLLAGVLSSKEAWMCLLLVRDCTMLHAGVLSSKEAWMCLLLVSGCPMLQECWAVRKPECV